MQEMQETWVDPRLGRSPGEEHGNPRQYSCLENPMDRGTWWATVHRVTKSRTQLKWLSMHVCILTATGKICCHHTHLLLNTLVIWLCILMLTLSQLTLKSLTNPSLSSEPWTPRAREGGRERPKEVWCLTSQTTASTPTSSKINVASVFGFQFSVGLS